MIRKGILSLFFTAFAAITFAQRPEVYLDYKRFISPEGKIMLEVYLQVNTLSTKLVLNPDKTLHCGVEITTIIKQGEVISGFKKNELMSPDMPDTMITDLIDQQRFLLAPGMYDLDITVRDMNNDSAQVIHSVVPLDLRMNTTSIALSDIQPIEGYSKAEKASLISKGGYDLIPFVSNYFSPDIEKLAYYFEIYHTDTLGAGEKFVVFQYIENEKTGEQLTEFSKFSKQDVKPVVPIMTVMDIKKLSSGDYNLVVEVRNKSNQLLAKEKWFFQRNNFEQTLTAADILSMDVKATFVEKIPADSLNEFIACLRPIAMPNEIIIIDTIIKGNNVDSKRQFFYYFWKSRNSMQPEESWYSYKKGVNDVNRMFATPIKKGYMTDRGAIFLKYGAPDYVYDRPNEPSSYPYQIWQYKKAGAFNNKRFIFYLPDLVTNDYALLHSEIPGELKNYRWQQILNSRNSPNVDIDSSTGGTVPQWGGNSGELFKNPR